MAVPDRPVGLVVGRYGMRRCSVVVLDGVVGMVRMGVWSLQDLSWRSCWGGSVVSVVGGLLAAGGALATIAMDGEGVTRWGK